MDFTEIQNDINTITENAFNEYEQAESAWNDAKQKFERDSVSQDAGVKLDAPKHYFEAKQAYQKACRRFEDHDRDFKEVRSKMEKQIDDKYSIDPSMVDHDTLEMLKTGIMNPNDYQKALEKAEADENITMIRLIGKYAEDASKNYASHDARSQAFQRIASEAKTNGNEHLQNFDALVDVFHRTSRNPAMIKHWHELTDDFIKNL